MVNTPRATSGGAQQAHGMEATRTFWNERATAPVEVTSTFWKVRKHILACAQWHLEGINTGPAALLR